MFWCAAGAVLSSPAHFSVVQHSHATLHATDPPKLRASGHPHQSNLNSLDHACDVLGLDTNVLVCCRCSALFPSSLQISWSLCNISMPHYTCHSSTPTPCASGHPNSSKFRNWTRWMRAHRHANVLGWEIHVWMCCICSALFHYYAAFLCLTTFTPFTYTTRASVVRFSEPFRIALAGCVEAWVEVLRTATALHHSSHYTQAH